MACRRATGIEFGKTGQPLMWPGQFLTGQPASQDDRPSLPPELTNGSFVVFRRLSQDVAAFYRDTEALAQELTVGDRPRRRPAASCETDIVGRFPSGASLMRHDQRAARADEPNEINYFEFGTALPAISSR